MRTSVVIGSPFLPPCSPLAPREVSGNEPCDGVAFCRLPLAEREGYIEAPLPQGERGAGTLCFYHALRLALPVLLLRLRRHLTLEIEERPPTCFAQVVNAVHHVRQALVQIR